MGSHISIRQRENVWMAGCMGIGKYLGIQNDRNLHIRDDERYEKKNAWSLIVMLQNQRMPTALCKGYFSDGRREL